MAVDSQFWRGRRVFLTGHTGFKGCWLSLWLRSLGAQVHGYALEPPTSPNLFDEARVSEDLVDGRGDIRDLRQLSSALAQAQPEIVIHMAAQSLVRYSYDHPVSTYETNVLGTVNLLEAVRRTPGIRAVVNVTTDKCYENQEWLWGYRENEPLGGYDPYSSSKGCAELVTSAWRRSYLHRQNIWLASARAGNVIGGGDWALDRIVPDIFRAIRESRPARIRNPDAMRPWQHVLEPLGGYLVLAQNLFRENGADYACAWNFGPSDEDVKPVRWIADRIVKTWGGTASWDHEQIEKPHEAQYLKLDISKARSLLGWQPSWNLEAALQRIVEWNRDWFAGMPAREICLRQITQYQSDSSLKTEEK